LRVTIRFLHVPYNHWQIHCKEKRNLNRDAIPCVGTALFQRAFGIQLIEIWVLAPETRLWMVEQTWARLLAKAVLLLVFGASAISCAFSQQAPAGSGSLSGKLTDIRSTPLENVTVTLRNANTGSQVETTTARGGRYNFTGLAQGEYSITATGPEGTGKAGGIFVTAGHQSRVQTALDFGSDSRQVSGHLDDVEAPPAPSESLAFRLRTLQAAALPVSSTMETKADAAPILLPTQPPVLLPLRGTRTQPTKSNSSASAPTPALPISLPAGSSIATNERLALPRLPAGAAPAVSVNPAVAIPILHFSANNLAKAILDLELGAEQASLLGVHVWPKAQLAVLRSSSLPQSSQSLDATQLQSLPLPGRDWQNFLRDVPEQGGASGDQKSSANIGVPSDITVDSAPVQLAFGSRDSMSSRDSNLLGPASGDVSTREVQLLNEGVESIHVGLSRTNLETQRGTEHLHGQVFVFDRENIWGARNPFTQWVKEARPATSTTVPLFTPQPYSPEDREALWGAGLGGSLRKRRLFWFVALDGYQRNDPGVATVKHPDNFFAQPSNDQMQLLSAQLGLSGADPVSEGLGAYSKLLKNLASLLGPVPRSMSQFTGFARIDGNVGERYRFTLEATGAQHDAPGGGFSRASATYGSHSFGNVNATRQWMLGKWEAFITPNLLAVTQGSFGHQVHSIEPQTPSAFEQSLNISAWGRLPQIVVDSRNGFTIGNPARFGKGSYPDEHLYMIQEQLNWVSGNVVIKAGGEIRHNTDATTRLRNQTGTYYYSSIADFASDALAFASFGLNGQLNPMHQHNCDQTGRAWRDSTGVLHGLGYLPCYSYYSQTMGPSNWWLSTNDWAGFVTSQWQPTRQLVATLAVRWELEQIPGPISTLNNADLPLTAHTATLGNQWGPRAGLAWGTGESRWPVVRLGYGMYFNRTRNSVLETVLTQTGSLKGDLNFFMRPTDNLNAGGAPPFPYVLAGEPASVVKPAAVEFAPNFRNGEIHQAEASIEETAPGRIHIEASAVASFARRLPVTFDANIDPTVAKTITYAVVDGNASGPIKSPQITVPFFASWPSSTSPTGFAGRLNPNYQQVSEIYSRANSTYEAAILRISRNARALTLRARYTYAHAMDWNPDETSQLGGPSVFDPIDFRQEYGTSSLDVRHSATAAVILQSPWKVKSLAGRIANGWMLSGTAYFHSGLPYTMRTGGSIAREFNAGGTAIVALGTGMNGYGGDNRVYGIGRNTYRYPSTWKADLRTGKRFDLGPMRQLELMVESFNLFNHQNVTELETTGYSIESGTSTGGLPRLNFLTGLKTGQTEFGTPLNINATDFYRERQVQFGARLRF